MRSTISAKSRLSTLCILTLMRHTSWPASLHMDECADRSSASFSMLQVKVSLMKLWRKNLITIFLRTFVFDSSYGMAERAIFR